MALIHKRKEIIKKLKEVDKGYKGTSQGSSIIKRFCREAIKDLDSTVKFKDSRENIEHLTGIKVRKIGKVYF